MVGVVLIDDGPPALDPERPEFVLDACGQMVGRDMIIAVDHIHKCAGIPYGERCHDHGRALVALAHRHFSLRRLVDTEHRDMVLPAQVEKGPPVFELKFPFFPVLYLFQKLFFRKLAVHETVNKFLVP